MSAKKHRRAAAKQSRFVLRVKALPPDAQEVQVLDNGTSLYADKFGTVYAVRKEMVVYRLLEGVE